MMKISNRKKLAIMVIFISIVVTLIYSRNVSNQAKLTGHIEAAMNNYLDGETSTIDIASISYFQWDRVYVFGPYSYCENIIDTLDSINFFLFRCKRTGIEDYDGITLFVFKRNGLIVGDAILGCITEELNENGYPHESAYFIINEKGRLVWDGD